MVASIVLPAGFGGSEGTHSVVRVPNIHPVHLGLDSLYIVLEYPSKDVYQTWFREVAHLDKEQLRAGVPVGEFLVRFGGNGYPISIWDGDARLFLTDRVNEELVGTPFEGRGQGMMLQLGPKWLASYGTVTNAQKLIENIFAQFVWFGVEAPANYSARLNRLDIALDVHDLAIKDFSIDQWRHGWVSMAQSRKFYDAPRTGELEGFSIGSAKGAVRFRSYNKVTESRKDKDHRFWCSVWGIDEEADIPVTRFEWSTRPFEARFTELRYLTDFNYVRYRELLNYVSFQWGRLCIPQEDENRSRWPLAPVWAELRQMIDEWTYPTDEVARRAYDYRPDLSDLYLKTVAGWLSGFMARVGVERGQDIPVTVSEAIETLHAEGLSLPAKAHEKLEVLIRLLGGRNHE